MHRSFAVLVSLVLGSAAFAFPAMAQELECHSGKDYLVAGKALKDEVGTQFAVTALNGKPAPKKCAFDLKKAEFVIGKSGDPLHFDKLIDNLLILSRSTGPQGDLVIYDLKTRKKVLDVPSDDYAVEGTNVTFWQRTVKATKKNCKEFDEHKKLDLTSIIAAQKSFDIRTAAVKDLGKSRCDSIQ